MRSVSVAADSPAELAAVACPGPAGSAGVGRQPDAGGTGRPGLVICAKTCRDRQHGHTSPAADDARSVGSELLDGLWKPNFVGTELVRAAAAMFNARASWDGHEGPRPRITISPGVVAIARPDLARRERAIERVERRRRLDVDLAAAELVAGDEPLHPETSKHGREIVNWSRKSRANMTQALGQLDYHPMLAQPGVPAMVTLTYPGPWLDVAQDGAAVKAHLLAFRKRFERAWARKLLAVWKLEFQDRGAPHFHLLMVPPRGTARQGRGVAAGERFTVWLSRTWADIVAHPDPVHRARNEAAGTNVKFSDGLKMTDPRRVSVYFTKHGSPAMRAKEYQHVVPAAWRQPGCGPGRFWGYWHLERAVQAVELRPGDALAAARLMRRWSHAQGVTRQVSVDRTPGGKPRSATFDVVGLAGAAFVTSAGHPRKRRVRRRTCRLPHGAGWVSVNNGPAFAAAIARYLDGRTVDEGDS